MKNKPYSQLAILAAAALLGCVSSAQADSTASASMSNVHIELIDLDPLDGITPAISFATTSIDSYNQIMLSGVGSAQHTGGLLGMAQGPITQGISTAWGQWQVFAGDILSGPGPGSSAFASASAGNEVWSFGEVISTDFTLTPHTRLVITADPSGQSLSAPLGGSAWASNQLSLLRYGPNGTMTGDTAQYASIIMSNGVTNTPPPTPIQVTFENLTDSPEIGWAFAGTFANAVGAAPVPEPQSLALMLTGLAGISFVARKRMRPRA